MWIYIDKYRKDIEMKKIMTVLFVLSVFFPLSANATYRLKLLRLTLREVVFGRAI
jgi:hypothetical protein